MSSTPLSYSRIRLFLACPKQYEFRLQQKPQTSLPLIMVRGKFAHAWYEYYVSACRDHNTRQMDFDESDVVSFNSIVYRATCRSSIAAGEPILTPIEWDDVYRTLCKPWAERTALPIEIITDTELKWALDQDGRQTGFYAPSVFFRGVIDRLEEEDTLLRIVDYKTGYGGKGDPMQADIYAWAFLGGGRPVEVVFEHTAMDMKETYRYTADDLPRLDTAIRALADVIHGTEEYRPTPGMACLECPYAYCCDAKADIQETIDDEDDAKKVVESLALLERDVKALKDSLRRWCEGNGPVSHNGIAWGVWKSDGLGFHDVDEFCKACNEIDMDCMPYLSVNNVKAKKLRKFFPNLVTGKPSLRFASKKAGSEEDE